MRTLYLDQLNRNPEGLRQTGNQTIMGAKIFEWNLLCALLEYGTFDAYFAPGVTEQVKEGLVTDGLKPGAVKRLIPVPLGSPLPVKESDQVVLLTAGRYLELLANLRNKLQRYHAPVCGFIHSINSARIALALLQQCFVGLSEADLLLCSSRAGMQTIDMYLDEVNRLLPSAIHYPVRRALVPLGVEMPAKQQEAGGALRQKLGLEAQDVIALYFGRLSQTSKCDLGPLLVAVSRLLSRGTELHLVIAGDDTQTKEAPRLEALANELRCHGSLTLWPNPSVIDKRLLYSGADLFVSPSDNIQETFGLTVAEAMAHGLPAVVSDWNGYRDLVQDYESGFLIPSTFPTNIESLRLCDSTVSMLQEDSLAQSTTIDVDILSEKLQKLALDRELRIRMGQAAKRYVQQNCTWSVVVKRYEELWDQSLGIARSVSLNGESQSNLLSSSLENYFSHYATTKRDRETKCFITPEGRAWLKRPSRLYFLCQLSTVPCPCKFVDMLRNISDHPGLSVANAVELFANGPSPRPVADAHWILARLFKYGLVSSKT